MQERAHVTKIPTLSNFNVILQVKCDMLYACICKHVLTYTKHVRETLPMAHRSSLFQGITPKEVIQPAPSRLHPLSTIL